MASTVYSLENPLFKSYMFYVAVLSLKMVLVQFATIYARLTRKVWDTLFTLFIEVFILIKSFFIPAFAPWHVPYPLGKIPSRVRPQGVPEKHPDVLRKSPYCPIYNAKGRIRSGTSLGLTQNVNLTIIHKMGFYDFFSVFRDSNCISGIVLPKIIGNLIRLILVLLWSGTFWPK